MMRDFFRRKTTQPATPTISGEDKYIAALSGYTPEQWAQLPSLARRDAREHITWRL